MYDKILVTLECSATDKVIVQHVKKLAAIMKSRVVLLHVATGVPAIVYGSEAAGEEVREDKAHLAAIEAEFAAAGIPVETALAFGDPAKEIIKWVEAQGCDLVAMSTHGHKVIGDLVFGATANKVQHGLSVPVLMLRAK